MCRFFVVVFFFFFMCSFIANVLGFSLEVGYKHKPYKNIGIGFFKILFWIFLLLLNYKPEV